MKHDRRENVSVAIKYLLLGLLSFTGLEIPLQMLSRKTLEQAQISKASKSADTDYRTTIRNIGHTSIQSSQSQSSEESLKSSTSTVNLVYVPTETSTFLSTTTLGLVQSMRIRARSSLTPQTSCVPTQHGNRICETYSGSFCEDIIKTENRSLASRNCSSSFKSVNTDLNSMFLLLKAAYDDDKECLDVTKWLVCTIIFPGCNSTHPVGRLPCRKVCEVIRNNLCHKQWHAFVNLQHTYKPVFIPPCNHFPSKTCKYPRFVTDIINKRKPQAKSGVNTNLIIGGVMGGVMFTVIVILIFILHCRKQRINRIVRQVSMKEIKEVHREVEQTNRFEALGETSPTYADIGSLVKALGITVFSKENLAFDQNLGEGAFGKVVKCKTRNIRHSMNIDLVAVKYLKHDASKEMERDFRKEVEILSNFDHPNVIPLVGVCLDVDGPMCLVLEFMKYGDLNQYIRVRSGSYHAVAGSYGNLPDGVEFSSPELSFHNLLLITSQVADGLSYLATKRFVHRDIATRNILVGENLQVKISDFGLARDIYGSDYYRVDTQKMLPLRWLSPEALSLGKFTIYSDMWAFGVTMWEIFTYGMQPFYGCNNDEVCQRIRCHKNLERPYCCPQKIYELMKACWKFEPTQRKKSSFIRDTIATWLNNEDSFIEESWRRLLLPPLPDRRPTISKAKLKFLNIRSEFTL